MILMENFLCLIGKLFHVVGKLNAPICYHVLVGIFRLIGAAMYAMIIFVSDYDETHNTVDGIFNNDGYSAAIDYLAQWDYGCESEYDLVEKVDRCPLENWHVRNDHGEEYILIEHPLYMTLYRKVEN